jgi:chromosomal replication initiator protein
MSFELDPRFTFESFVVGASNRLAAAAARRAAESPGTSYNPLVIYSGSGLGKTHLLNSVAHLAISVQPELNVRYEPIEQLVDRVTAAISGGGLDGFREEYLAVDLLLLDDIQFLAGKGRTQEELLRVWDEMARSGAQVVLASDRPPQEIDGLDARLLSRLSGGLIVDLAAPELETRVEIVRRKAQERGVELGREVAEAIARVSRESVRELQGGLNRILALQEAESRPVAAHEVGPLLRVQVVEAPREDEFSAFLSDISTTVAQLVEAAPWRRRVAEAILRWEGEGIRTRRLEEVLEVDSAPDVDVLLATFAADVEGLRAVEAELRTLAPEAAASPVLRDPDRVPEAEALLETVRLVAAPLPPPPAGPTLEALAGRYGEGSLVVKCVRRALGRRGAEYNPLFVHGPAGSGKTSFLAAVGAALRAERPEARVAYLPAGRIAEELAPAVRAGAAELWRRRYREVDLLLVDDLQALPGQERLHEELFYLLDALLRSEVQIVVAAGRAPRDLAGLDARLRSRFEGGLVLDVAPPPAPEPVRAPERKTEPEVDRWYFNPEKIAWSALALEDRLIEELG